MVRKLYQNEDFGPTMAVEFSKWTYIPGPAQTAIKPAPIDDKENEEKGWKIDFTGAKVTSILIIFVIFIEPILPLKLVQIHAFHLFIYYYIIPVVVIHPHRFQKEFFLEGEIPMHES